MNPQDLVALALEIQRIPSPTFEEQDRACFVRDRFARAGLHDVGIDHVGNVLGRCGGAAERATVVSAHLDSVFPREQISPARRDGQRLIGPGIGDNALGIAALIGLAHDLPALRLEMPVWLAATVGEEGLGDLRGMQALVDRFGSTARGYLVIEGMALGSVYHAGLPARRLRITIQTPGGHSWTHAGQPSATHEIIRLAERLLRLPVPDGPRTTMNIGVLKGGTAINAIAAQASMDIDLRSEDESVLDSLRASVERHAAAHRAPNVRVGCELIGTRPGGGLPADHPLVEAAIRSLQASGVAEVHLSRGSTDASAPLSRGLPSVCVGLTRGRHVHSLEEEVEIDPIARGYAALLRLVQETAALTPPG